MSDPIKFLEPLPNSTDFTVEWHLPLGTITVPNSIVDTTNFLRGDGVWAVPPTAGGLGTWWYGNGEDGSATLDGAATVSWATRVGSVYTMTRSIAMANLTVDVGVTLIVVGYAIYVNGTLTNNGTIHNNGTNGTWSFNTSGAVGNCYGGGGSGVTTNAAGSDVNNALGGNGGIGGEGADGPVAWGPALAALPTEAAGGKSCIGSIWCATSGRSYTNTVISGGAGGRGGAATVAHVVNQGSGGSGAGVVPVFAKAIAGNGLLQANGGNGANALTGDCGGGGGGGGGVIFLITGTTTVLSDWTVTVDGGTGGTGFATGETGQAGRIMYWILE